MSGGDKFMAARRFLLDNRTDYEKVKQEFRWPEFGEFNWARDWFDVYARENTKTALWVKNERSADVKLTYQELSERSDRVANFMQRLGVKPQDRLIVLLPNMAELWELMLAAIKIGAVIVPTATQVTEGDLKDRLIRSHAKYIFTDEAGLSRIPAEYHGTLVLSGGKNADCVTYDEAFNENRDYAQTVTNANDPLLLYFTSGTTSKAKLVLHTHRSYPAGHLSSMYWIGIKETDIHQNISSPGWAKHAYSCFFAPFNAGATVFVHNYERFQPIKTMSLLNEAGINTLCAPPTVWRLLIQGDLGKKPTALRELASAGEPLNPEVIEQVEAAWGIQIRDGYGQTETTLQIGNTPGQVLKVGSMGRAMPGYEMCLIDAQNQECDEGEIAVKLDDSPAGLMSGYLDEAGGIKAMSTDSFYRTGDEAVRDADGYYFFVGRGDDVFKCSDYRISPFELESVLIEHPAVAEAAIVPSPDPVRTNVPKAFISLCENFPMTDATAREILFFAKEKLAPYQRIRKLEFYELPKTISGKIRRVELRKLEADRVGTGSRGGQEFWLKDFE